jgi:hypothetical protein
MENSTCFLGDLVIVRGVEVENIRESIFNEVKVVIRIILMVVFYIDHLWEFIVNE